LYLSILVNQINDYGWQYKSIHIRTLYDIFLISKKCSINTLIQFDEKLQDLISIYLTVTNKVLNTILHKTIQKRSKLYLYVNDFLYLMQDDKKRLLHRRLTRKKVLLKKSLNIFYKSLINLDHRTWLLNKLKNKFK
jgi:hypothetical protein